jgi:hypothetical protein
VTYTPKEVTVELADDTLAADVRQKVEAALSGADAVLWLEDRKGRHIAVPADKISYVEIGSAEADRPIGFG